MSQQEASLSPGDLEAYFSEFLGHRAWVVSLDEKVSSGSRLGIAVLEADIDKAEGQESGEFKIEKLASEICDRLGAKFKIDLDPKLFLVVDKIPILSGQQTSGGEAQVDRVKMKALFTMKSKLQFPVSVYDLIDYFPHRGPAIWVDDLLEARPDFVRCRVKLDPSRRFFSEGQIRESSPVEWIAQGFGYGFFVGELLYGTYHDVQKVFLAGVKNFEILDRSYLQKQSGESEVAIRRLHDFGQLKVIEGSISTDGRVWAQAQLRVFSG